MTAGKRKFLAFAFGVMALALMGTLGLLIWQDLRLTAASADQHLDTIRLAQRLVEAQDARDLSTRAELIAGNQAVVGYVTQALGGALPGTTIDRSSIIDLLEERRDQLGLAVAAVIDSDGRLVATTERFSATRDFGKEPLFVAARKAQALRTGLWVDGSRLLNVAILPLAAYGSGDAYLLVAVPVNQAYAQTIAEIGATDVALVASAPEGPLVIASTLDPDAITALRAALPRVLAEPDARLQIDLDGARRDVSVAPLLGSRSAHLVAVVSPKRDAASFSAVRLPMAVGAVIVLLGLVFALVRLWTRLLGPVERLDALMAYAADTGDTRLKVPVEGGRTITRLATTFNRLLARLQ